MSANPVVAQLLPESAPCTPEQRTWLSGLFAGLLGLDQAVTPLSPAEAAALVPGLLPASAGPADEGPITWHDPGIPIAERMKLAEGRSSRLQLIAALAHQGFAQGGTT